MVNSQLLSNVCSYCNGKEGSNSFNILDDELYNMMLSHRDYDRQSLFCLVCTNRIRRKLEISKKKRKKNLQRNGNTYQTLSQPLLPPERNANSSKSSAGTSGDESISPTPIVTARPSDLMQPSRTRTPTATTDTRHESDESVESISSVPSVTAETSNLMQPSRTRTPTATTHTLSRHESDKSISPTPSATSGTSDVMQQSRTRNPRAATLSSNKSDSFTTAPMPKNRPIRLPARSSISSFPQDLLYSQQLFGRGSGG